MVGHTGLIPHPQEPLSQASSALFTMKYDPPTFPKPPCSSVGGLGGAKTLLLTFGVPTTSLAPAHPGVPRVPMPGSLLHVGCRGPGACVGTRAATPKAHILFFPAFRPRWTTGRNGALGAHCQVSVGTPTLFITHGMGHSGGGTNSRPAWPCIAPLHCPTGGSVSRGEAWRKRVQGGPLCL